MTKQKRNTKQQHDGHYGFPVFRLLTDFVCLYTYECSLSLWKIVRSSIILLLPLQLQKNNRKIVEQKIDTGTNIYMATHLPA
jgi:hypothetical protein